MSNINQCSYYNIDAFLAVSLQRLSPFSNLFSRGFQTNIFLSVGLLTVTYALFISSSSSITSVDYAIFNFFFLMMACQLIVMYLSIMKIMKWLLIMKCSLIMTRLLIITSHYMSLLFNIFVDHDMTVDNDVCGDTTWSGRYHLHTYRKWCCPQAPLKMSHYLSRKCLG